jgi:8-oxo-dGTP diphosphatase
MHTTRHGQIPSMLLALTALLAGCTREAPPCPVPDASDIAPSAGCFSVTDGKLLVVQGLSGKIGLPGGLSAPGEAAQCTAFRESWEETGLYLEPVELLRVFSKDFRLYRCDYRAHPGNTDPPISIDAITVLRLSPGQLDDYTWRFDEERDVVYALLAGRDP